MTIAEQLKKGRLQSGLSRKDAAQKAGVSLRSLAYYETGERIPNAETLLRLCDAYNLSADDLIRENMGEEKPEADDLKKTIDAYLAFQQKKERAVKKGVLVTLAIVSAVVLSVLLVLCLLRFRLSALYGYSFSEATASLWTGLFNALIAFVNDETVKTLPVFSITLGSVIILGWLVYGIVKWINGRKNK